MASVRQNQKSVPVTDFFEFLKKQWLVLLGLIIAIPLLYRYYLNQKNANDKAENDATVQQNWNNAQIPLTQSEMAYKITRTVRVHSEAQSVAHHFGTAYIDKPLFFGWEWTGGLNPRAWTENDEEAYLSLSRERRNVKYMRRLYSEVYTKGRNLSEDIKKYLPTRMANALKNQGY